MFACGECLQQVYNNINVNKLSILFGNKMISVNSTNSFFEIRRIPTPSVIF